MIIEVKVPSPGESITEVQLASWLVEDGEIIEQDAEIAEVDSDKATLTINAPEQGMIKLLVQAGDTVNVGTIIATIDTAVASTGKKEVASPASGVIAKESSKPSAILEKSPVQVLSSIEEHSSVQKQSTGETSKKTPLEADATDEFSARTHITPLARKIMEERNLSNDEVVQQLGGKRVGKADIETMNSNKKEQPEPQKDIQLNVVNTVSEHPGEVTRQTERKKLSTLRLKLSQRLVSVKNETAMLTTFNEVNMTKIMELKKKYNDKFKEKYGVSVGFMSLFTKAVTIALQQFPQVNSTLDGDEMIYHNYVDVGIAVSSPKGLVVPVLRNTETLSIVEIELLVKELAGKARNNKISLDEMTGGTFTITNGGVFGSLLSTPILNPPQSAILGMHNIVERPIALNGQVVIAPMMYVALSYDHRVIDGKESVSFLVRVKELLENPGIMYYEGIDPVKGLLGI